MDSKAFVDGVQAVGAVDGEDRCGIVVKGILSVGDVARVSIGENEVLYGGIGAFFQIAVDELRFGLGLRGAGPLVFAGSGQSGTLNLDEEGGGAGNNPATC